MGNGEWELGPLEIRKNGNAYKFFFLYFPLSIKDQFYLPTPHSFSQMTLNQLAILTLRLDAFKFYEQFFVFEDLNCWCSCDTCILGNVSFLVYVDFNIVNLAVKFIDDFI